MKKVLSTKLLDNTAIAFGRDLGLDIQSLDYIVTKPIEFAGNLKLLEKSDSLAFTSANAVHYFFGNDINPDYLTGRKIFAISPGTSEALLKNQVEADATAGNAEGLADALIMAGAQHVTHLCGSLALDVMRTKLEAAGIAYTQLLVYKTELKNHPKPDENFDVVMFFSPSGAESFFISNDVSESVVYCCIGETTAAFLKGKYKQIQVIVSEKPSALSMIERIYKYKGGAA